MLRYINLLLFSIILNINCAEIKEAEALKVEKVITSIRPYASHCMLIFLDDVEEDLGPIGYDALLAIYQKAAPILISSHLLANIVLNTIEQLDETYKKDETLVPEYEKDYAQAKDHFDEIYSLLKSQITTPSPSPEQQKEIVDQLNKKFNRTQITFEGKRAILKSLVKFNPNEWIIKEVPATDGVLLLLIPCTYKPALTKISGNNTFSSETLTLGLKVDNMSTIAAADIFEFLKKQKKIRETSDYFISAISNASKNSNLFIRLLSKHNL